MSRARATAHENGETPALRVTGLTKQYGKLAVLNKLDMTLPAGSLVGLLGPNGAGKSTLLKLLAGLIAPDAGTIQIAGHDLAREEVKARASLAYVPDVPSLYSELTVLEHLELVARAHGTVSSFPADSQDVLTSFGLWEARNNPSYALSRGMIQKTALAAAFMRPSRLMLLDEPGGSLDIASLDVLYELLRQYRSLGGTAVVSSHQWETLEELCDNFVLLAPGQLTGGDLNSLRRGLGLAAGATLREIYLAFISGERVELPGPRSGNGVEIVVRMDDIR